EPAALLGSPGASAVVVFAGAASFLVLTAVAWALARQRRPLARRVTAFGVVSVVVYLLSAFDGAKFVIRDGIPSIAIQPEPHYAAMLCLALGVGLVAGVAKPPSFKRPFVLPAAVASAAVFATLLAWPAASNIGARKASIERGFEDAERALERAGGATQEGHDAYFENVDLPFVPRAIVGRDRARFPGLFAYFVLAHPGGELGDRAIHFV